MKRYGNLYEKIITFDNLLLSAQKAQKGKRYHPNILEFNYNLENELLRLQQELTNQTYQPGQYNTFFITEPKPRLISAAPYRDRVIHHALCNIIVPLIEPSLIPDTYANRKGYGTHKALKRFIQFARSSQYILQCDIKKYFPNIDHAILKQLIRQKIKCQDTLWLIDTIIDNSNEQPTQIEYFPEDNLLTPLERRKGLPIGNLTSQFFANFYLNNFDHFLKEQMHVKKYVRYVDDFACCSDDWEFLQEVRKNIETYLMQLRLKIHPIKSQLFASQSGATFLGFRVLPDHIRVKSDNIHRGRKRLKYLKQTYFNGDLVLEKVLQSIQSWFAHLQHGNTWQLQKQIFTSLDWLPIENVEKG